MPPQHLAADELEQTLHKHIRYYNEKRIKTVLKD